MMEYNRLTKVTIVNFPKIFPTPICPNITQPCILWSTLMIFLQIVVLRWVHEVGKIIISKFFKKISFNPYMTEVVINGV